MEPVNENQEAIAYTDFSEALRILRNGNNVTREGWNGAGQFITLQIPDEHSKMTLGYIYITTTQGDRVPWLASQTDLLANDWYELKTQEESVVE